MVRLISPYFVRPFVRGSKNDAADAQAIFEAAGRSTMHFVPVKSLECQDLQSLHRIRDRLVHNRTSLINHTRGRGRVPWRGVAEQDHHDPRRGRAGQAATAGRLTSGSSLIGAMVSRVM